MEIRQLRYFLKIAELGSFSRASLSVHIAQPALSYQMAQLESELGHVLLHRRHTGVTVTEQGRTFYSHAQRILKEIDDLPAVVNSCAAQLRGTVCVGLPPDTATQYAMPLLAEIRERHPGINLELSDEAGANLLRGISDGRFEIAVIVNAAALRAEAVPLMDEELFFITSPKNEVGLSLAVDTLAKMPLALPSIRHDVRALIEAAVRAQGATLPTPVIVANSMSIIRRAVSSGAFSSVMPWGAICDEVCSGAVRAVPFEPRLSHRIHVCSSKDTGLSAAGRAVRDLLIEVTRRRVTAGEWQGVTLI